MSEVKFTGRHVPGRARACASITVGDNDLDAWGEDHEEARSALVEQLERRVAEAQSALDIARATIAPEPSHDR